MSKKISNNDAKPSTPVNNKDEFTDMKEFYTPNQEYGLFTCVPRVLKSANSSRVEEINTYARPNVSWAEDIDKEKLTVMDDNISMLNVVITTTMLLASRVPTIPQSYIDWTIKYLKCIKDSNGQYPDNIKKLLDIVGYKEDLLDELLKQDCDNTLK